MAILASLFLSVVAATSVQGLICNEGFNFTIAGLPSYHWVERECANNSDCFMQELRTEFYNTGVEVAASYGGCISNSYSHVITCQSLFGEDSTLNPTVLINMIPDFQEKTNLVWDDFMRNRTKHLKELLSNGKGQEEFIVGIYEFLENLGFNTEEISPLLEPIIELFKASFPYTGDYESYRERVTSAGDKLLEKLGQLGNGNSLIAENIYSVFGDFKKTKYAPLAENLPELIRSTLPTYMKPDWWFDFMFDIVGDFVTSDLTLTSKNIVKTIKEYWDMPENEKKYINLFLDFIPGVVDLYETSEGNVLIDVLRQSSTQNAVTRRLSASALRVLKIFVKDVWHNVKGAIDWLPGISYYLFPEEITEINRVYVVLSEYFESLDFSSANETMETTHMSNFVLFMTERTGLFYPIVRDQKKSKQMNELIIINTAKTVYNLIPGYTQELDNVFSSALEAFEIYPYFNVSILILNHGLEVPLAFKPILDNLPSVLSTVYNANGMNFKPEEFRREIKRIISEYKEMYPESDFPDIAERYVDYVYKFIDNQPNYSDCTPVNDWWNDTEVNSYFNCTNAVSERVRKFNHEMGKESLNISTDLKFAVFKVLDYPGNPLFKALVKVFPDFELYLKAMRLLEPSDVKEIIGKYWDWIYNYYDDTRRMTTESFLQLINGTLSRTMVKLDEVVKDLRILFSPDSCQYFSCGDHLCNTRDVLKSQEPFRRDPSKRKFGQFPTRKTESHTTEAPTTAYAGFSTAATTTAQDDGLSNSTYADFNTTSSTMDQGEESANSTYADFNTTSSTIDQGEESANSTDSDLDTTSPAMAKDDETLNSTHAFLIDTATTSGQKGESSNSTYTNPNTTSVKVANEKNNAPTSTYADLSTTSTARSERVNPTMFLSALGVWMLAKFVV